jgi:hypothetical protein
MILDSLTREPINLDTFKKKLFDHYFQASLFGSSRRVDPESDDIWFLQSSHAVLCNHYDYSILDASDNWSVVYMSVNIFSDTYGLSNLLPRIKKDLGNKNMDRVFFILTDDHIVTKEDILISNFSIMDIGFKVSDVLSTRYSVPIFSIKEKFINSRSTLFVVNSIAGIGLSSTYDSLRINSSMDNLSSFRSDERSLNFVFNYDGSLVDEDLKISNMNHSYLEFSKDGQKFITEYGSYSSASEKMYRSEIFSVFYANVKNFISSMDGRLYPDKVIDKFIIHRKIDGRIITEDLKSLFIWNWVNSVSKSIKENEFMAVLSSFGLNQNDRRSHSPVVIKDRLEGFLLKIDMCME